MIVLVIVCGGLGALARFAVDGLVQSRRLGSFPLGTLLVNLTGCFLLGLLSRLNVSGHAMTLLGTATLGSYTTFSTWMFEAERLGEEGDTAVGVMNIVVSAAAGVAAAGVGWAIGASL